MITLLLTAGLLWVIGHCVLPLLLPILLLSFLAQIMGNKPERVFFGLSRQLWRWLLSFLKRLRLPMPARSSRVGRQAGRQKKSPDMEAKAHPYI